MLMRMLLYGLQNLKGGSMKRIAIVSAALLMLAVYGCSKPVQTSSPVAPATGIAATVNGQTITMEELNTSAKNQLKKVEMETYKVLKNSLDDMIDDKLIADAAKKKGVDAEKYLAEEIDAKVQKPTEEEMKAMYESSKGKLGGKTYDEVKKQISDYLEQSRKARARNELMSQLKQGAEIKISLEPPRVDVDISKAPTIGDKDAKITLIEFSDYQCPFCMRVRPAIWKLMDEYKGKIRYAFMDFPLSFHKDAKKASEAARCAGDQGKYFEFNKKIFDNQSKIGVEDLKKYAKELQLKMKDFDSCLDNGKHAKDVEESVEIGINSGVSGTPAYFINGIMLSGAVPYESFKEIIETELKK